MAVCDSKTDTLPPPLVFPPAGSSHEGTVIFLHGAGDTGTGISEWIAHRLGGPLRFHHLKVVFPNASSRPYSPAGGRLSSVWFDFPEGIQYTGAEDIRGTESRIVQINDVIRREIRNGVSPDRIVLGGLSQGGILSLHVGMRFRPPLAGIFALSCYLPERCLLLDHLRARSTDDLARVPVYMTHGDRDQLIRLEWGRLTRERLADLGVPTTFREYPGLGHDLSKEELQDLKAWILERLPNCSTQNK